MTGGAQGGMIVLWPVFAQYEPRFECAQQPVLNETGLDQCHLANGTDCEDFVYFPGELNQRKTWRNETGLLYNNVVTFQTGLLQCTLN